MLFSTENDNALELRASKHIASYYVAKTEGLFDLSKNSNRTKGLVSGDEPTVNLFIKSCMEGGHSFM